MRTRWLRAVAIGSAVLLGCFQALAQDAQGLLLTTRANEIIEAERAKSGALKPVAPPRAEQEFDRLEKRIIDPITDPNGLTFQLGGLPTGGGFSFGPRYTRRDLLQNRLTSDSYVVGSAKKWYRLSSSLRLIGLFDGHLEFAANAAYENAASVPYFGEGFDSSTRNRSAFRREFTTAHMGGQLHLLDRKLSVGYAVGGLLVNVGPGDRGGWPPTDRLFNEANTPGLQNQSNFVTGTASVTLD